MDWQQLVEWAIQLAPTIWAIYSSRDNDYKPRH